MLKVKTLVKKGFLFSFFIYYKLKYYFNRILLDILETILWDLKLDNKLSDDVRNFLECHIEAIEGILFLESISYFTSGLETVRQNLLWANLSGAMVEEITSRVSVLWVLLNWERLSFNTGDVEIIEVDIQHYHDIYNICLDQPLSTLFLIWKSIWVLGDVEVAEEENELKLLETSYEECKEALDNWKKKDVSLEIIENRACNIVDELYDDINLRLDRQVLSNWWKRSCRIRKKVYSPNDIEYWYTLKRKHKKEKNESWVTKKRRKSDEKESPILKPDIFYDMLEWSGLRKTRTKRKHRRSFSISYFDKSLRRHVNAQLDIDKYDHEEIPEFVEIECHDDEAIKNIIEKLGFEDKEVFTKGSRGIYRKYEVYDDYDREYEVDDNTWEVRWKDGNIWNTHQNSILKI